MAAIAVNYIEKAALDWLEDPSYTIASNVALPEKLRTKILGKAPRKMIDTILPLLKNSRGSSVAP